MIFIFGHSRYYTYIEPLNKTLEFEKLLGCQASSELRSQLLNLRSATPNQIFQWRLVIESYFFIGQLNDVPSQITYTYQSPDVMFCTFP
jgi:hypothetical protein